MNRRMTGAEYGARAMAALGVRYVFFVPTILSRTLYEIERCTTIGRVLAHSEKAAAYMADGYARASGQPGICMAQTIGVANLSSGLRDARMGCSPVVALTGGPYEENHGRRVYQEVDDASLFAPVTKLSVSVPSARRLPDLLPTAFRLAVSGKPGPVHLEFPGHLGELLEAEELEAELPAGPPPRVPFLRAIPEAPATDAALRLLLAAERPVIVVGGGARASGAGPSIIRLAERLQIPVATSLNGKDTISGEHPLNVGVVGLYSRPSANEVVREADIVFFVGSQTGSQVTLNWQVPRLDSPVIQLDISPDDLGRHYPNTLPLLGDARETIKQMLTLLEGAESGAASRAVWVQQAQAAVGKWRQAASPQLTSDATPVRPERLCYDLSRHLPDDAMVVADTGHAGMWTAGYLDLKPTQRYLRAAGSLGWAFPAGVGAQLAQPDRPVVVFTGDGGLWYHLSELETAARWRVPVVVVVNNNHSLNQEIGLYTQAYGGKLTGRHGELWQFENVDFARVAELMGVNAFKVKKASEFQGALAKAIELHAPALVEVETDVEALAPKPVLPP